MNKTVGIVLPTIGREFYLEQSIASLLSQDEKFDEFLIYDNSVDQNLQNNSIYKDNEQITWHKSGKQVGPIDSWNNAILLSSCEYVVVVGDDDIFDKNYIYEAKKIVNISELGFLRPIMIDENNNILKTPSFPSEKILSADEFRYRRFKNKISLYVPGAVFKKEIFEKVGGFKGSGMDGYAYSDELLYYRMSILSNNVGFSENICWKYRRHSGQIGGVKELSTFTDQAFYYVKLFEDLLIKLGLNKNELYFQDFSREDYIAGICKYGIHEYGMFCSSNKNIFTLLNNMKKHFLFDRRISKYLRIYNLISVLKLFLKLKVNYMIKMGIKK